MCWIYFIVNVNLGVYSTYHQWNFFIRPKLNTDCIYITFIHISLQISFKTCYLKATWNSLVDHHFPQFTFGIYFLLVYAQMSLWRSGFIFVSLESIHIVSVPIANFTFYVNFYPLCRPMFIVRQRSLKERWLSGLCDTKRNMCLSNPVCLWRRSDFVKTHFNKNRIITVKCLLL